MAGKKKRVRGHAGGGSTKSPSPPANMTGYGKGASDRGLKKVGKATPKRRGQRR